MKGSCGQKAVAEARNQQVRAKRSTSSDEQVACLAKMAAYDLYSHSPRVSDVASPLHHGPDGPGPITPIHSPHHSVHSTASLRTPLHTLSIHEYRKQQSTPLSQNATPSGRTLRRKAAASTLNEIERVPSLKSAPRRDSHSSSRPLHSSFSTHQLAPQGQYLGAQPVPDQVLRSHSAEPWTQGVSISSVASFDSQGKVKGQAFRDFGR